jgi:signal transduction histidine kinase
LAGDTDCEDYEIETRVDRGDGEFTWVTARGMVIRDEQGRPLRMIGIGADISARKRTEAALRASEKLAASGRLAAALAHEINNPLAAITNLLFLLGQDPSLVGASQQYVDMAAAELGRVSHITRSMLGFYREVVSPARVKLSEVVQAVLDIYGPQLMRAGISISNEVESEAPVEGFAGELQQVISNLLLNAMESMPRGGKIRIHVHRAREWAKGGAGTRVVIADNGPGIELSLRGRLFEPFFSTKVGKGTGLGLWVSSNIVQRHKGAIRFRSCTRPGRSGTCFSLFFPEASAAQPRGVGAGA